MKEEMQVVFEIPAKVIEWVQGEIEPTLIPALQLFHISPVSFSAVQIYYAHCGEREALHIGRLQVLEGYSVKEGILIKGNEQKRGRESLPVLLAFIWKYPTDDQSKDQ